MTPPEPPWLTELVESGFEIAPVVDLSSLGLVGIRKAGGNVDTVHIWSPGAAAAATVPDDPLGNLFSQMVIGAQLLGTSAAVVEELWSSAPRQARASTWSSTATTQRSLTGRSPNLSNGSP